MKTIHELRKLGYKIRVRHFRVMHDDESPNPLIYPVSEITRDLISPQGGKTEITVTCPDGKEDIGVATCSMADTFNHKIGNELALSRAMRKLRKFDFFKRT